MKLTTPLLAVLLFVATVLALFAVTAGASDLVIDHKMLSSADLRVKTQAAPGSTETVKATPLSVLTEACGARSQTDTPFSDEELATILSFGIKSPKKSQYACQAFRSRLAI